MENRPNIIHPNHCFCHIPETELLYWARKRYLEGICTLELINSTDDPQAREAISIVCMLDLDEIVMLEMMRNVNKPDQHILNCREYVKRLLEMENITQNSACN